MIPPAQAQVLDDDHPHVNPPLYTCTKSKLLRDEKYVSLNYSCTKVVHFGNSYFFNHLETVHFMILPNVIQFKM